MAKVLVSDGVPFEIEALDAQFGGRRSSILKVSTSNGVPSAVFGIDLMVNGALTVKTLTVTSGVSASGTSTDVTAGRDVVAGRDVTAVRNIAATATVSGALVAATGATGDVTAARDVTAVRKMTVNGALVLAGNPFRKLVAVGSNGAGNVAFAGAKAGDLVVQVLNLTDTSDVTDKFEGTIAADGQIAQSAADNLSAKTCAFLLIKQS